MNGLIKYIILSVFSFIVLSVSFYFTDSLNKESVFMELLLINDILFGLISILILIMGKIDIGNYTIEDSPKYGKDFYSFFYCLFVSIISLFIYLITLF